MFAERGRHFKAASNPKITLQELPITDSYTGGEIPKETESRLEQRVSIKAKELEDLFRSQAEGLTQLQVLFNRGYFISKYSSPFICVPCKIGLHVGDECFNSATRCYQEILEQKQGSNKKTEKKRCQDGRSEKKVKRDIGKSSLLKLFDEAKIKKGLEKILMKVKPSKASHIKLLAEFQGTVLSYATEGNSSIADVGDSRTYTQQSRLQKSKAKIMVLILFKFVLFPDTDYPYVLLTVQTMGYNIAVQMNKAGTEDLVKKLLATKAKQNKRVQVSHQLEVTGQEEKSKVEGKDISLLKEVINLLHSYCNFLMADSLYRRLLIELYLENINFFLMSTEKHKEKRVTSVDPTSDYSKPVCGLHANNIGKPELPNVPDVPRILIDLRFLNKATGTRKTTVPQPSSVNIQDGRADLIGPGVNVQHHEPSDTITLDPKAQCFATLFFLPARQTLNLRPHAAPTEDVNSAPLTAEELRDIMHQTNFRIASLLHLRHVFDIRAMVDAGLYLEEGEEDIIRCYECDLEVPRQEWPAGEDPECVHRQMSPECPRIRQAHAHSSVNQTSINEISSKPEDNDEDCPPTGGRDLDLQLKCNDEQHSSPASVPTQVTESNQTQGARNVKKQCSINEKTLGTVENQACNISNHQTRTTVSDQRVDNISDHDEQYGSPVTPAVGPHWLSSRRGVVCYSQTKTVQQTSKPISSQIKMNGSKTNNGSSTELSQEISPEAEPSSNQGEEQSSSGGTFQNASGHGELIGEFNGTVEEGSMDSGKGDSVEDEEASYGNGDRDTGNQRGSLAATNLPTDCQEDKGVQDNDISLLSENP